MFRSNHFPREAATTRLLRKSSHRLATTTGVDTTIEAVTTIEVVTTTEEVSTTEVVTTIEAVSTTKTSGTITTTMIRVVSTVVAATIIIHPSQGTVISTSRVQVWARGHRKSTIARI